MSIFVDRVVEAEKVDRGGRKDAVVAAVGIGIETEDVAEAEAMRNAIVHPHQAHPQI